MDELLRQQVRLRADDRCEYCRLQQRHMPLLRHQIEHVVPRKHHGSDDFENLALACARCNLGKSSNLTGIDIETGQIVPLFNPRKQTWHDHFTFVSATVVGRTACGRVTVDVLNMNEPPRVRLRSRLLTAGQLD